MIKQSCSKTYCSKLKLVETIVDLESTQIFFFAHLMFRTVWLRVVIGIGMYEPHKISFMISHLLCCCTLDTEVKCHFKFQYYLHQTTCANIFPFQLNVQVFLQSLFTTPEG